MWPTPSGNPCPLNNVCAHDFIKEQFVMISTIVTLEHLFGRLESLGTLAHYPLHTLWRRGSTAGVLTGWGKAVSARHFFFFIFLFFLPFIVPLVF